MQLVHNQDKRSTTQERMVTINPQTKQENKRKIHADTDKPMHMLAQTEDTIYSTGEG